MHLSKKIIAGIDNNWSTSGVLDVTVISSDEDGYGNPNMESQTCELPDGYVTLPICL